MKILLLNPPNFNSQYISRDLMGGLGIELAFRKQFFERLMTALYVKGVRLPVTTLAYCAAVLSEYCDLAVLDAATLSLSEQETTDRIEREKPDYVIAATSISALLKEAKFLSDVKNKLGVAVGLLGDAASMLNEKVFTHHPIDFIILGDEPESVIGEIGRNKTYKGIGGILCRENNKIANNRKPELIDNLDSLPFPKWEFFPIDRYRYFPILRKTPVLSVRTTRGCPYGCNYCPYTSNQGSRYRTRSVKNVLEELCRLTEKHKVKSIVFRDPTFTTQKERTMEICEGIIDNNLRIEWSCETRMDCIDEELIEKMAESGCKGINTGIESSDFQVIKNAKRGWIDLDQIRKMVQKMVDSGIRATGFFIIGLPGETRKSFENTLNFALDVPFTYADFKIATPYPGTPLFDLAEQNRWFDEMNIEKYTSNTPSMRISHELSSTFMSESINRSYRSFYMRPAKIIKEIFSGSFIPRFFSVIVGN